MTLKEAREKGKLAEFIRQKEKQVEPADKRTFKKVVQAMSKPADVPQRKPSRKKKPTRGTPL